MTDNDPTLTQQVARELFYLHTTSLVSMDELNDRAIHIINLVQRDTVDAFLNGLIG